jgi:ATP-dependent helicase Lhr and Lhr-like helicase
MNEFERLHPALQHHIVNALGWRDLRPVQALSITAYLDGANLIILAPTAGGKTEAAFFPVLSQMLTESWEGLSVLYVSPIKALLKNQEHRLARYFQLVGRRSACWHGDTPQSEKRQIVADPPDCLLSTPESLEALLVSAKIDHAHFFQNVRTVVIDELHAFAGDDRGWHLLSVFARIQRIAGRDIQRIGLSATVGNPEEMLMWLSSCSERPRQVVWPRPSAKREPDVQLDFVGTLSNAAKVISLLHKGEKRLVFCDSRSRVEQLALLLREHGIETFVSHSSLGIEERRSAEQAFASRQNCVIVATSSLELGLDVGDLDRVIQIDAPPTVSSFLQRMGRTGRRDGATPNCLWLATTDEGLLRAAALLGLWRDGFVEPVNPPEKPYHILAQQLMALILQEKGVGPSEWFRWIDTVPAYRHLDPAVVTALVRSMLDARILWSDDGVLSFAPEGEASFGRKNFMELLSVFTSAPLFRVMAGQKELGSVHESTFYKRDEGPAILVLGGRSWKTNHLDWKRRIAHVEPTDERGRSRWLGEGQMLSFRLCRSIRKILAADDHAPFWSSRATAALEDLRAEYSWASPEATSIVRHPNGDVRWWTFGGGIANAMLGDHLRVWVDARADNLSIKFPATSTLDSVMEWISGIRADDVRPVVNPTIIENMKFTECLSLELAAEVYRSRFNDIEAVRKIVMEPKKVVVEQQG